jgi:hypothetical protein
MATTALCFLVVLLTSFARVAWAQNTQMPIQVISVPVEGLTNSRSNSTSNSYVIGKYPDNFKVFEHLVKPLTQATNLYPCPAFIWDGRRGMLCTTGVDLRSADDPVDVRMVRFAGGTQDNPDYDTPIYANALIGQFGHSVIVNRKIKAYEAVFQFYTRGNRTGYVCGSFSGREMTNRYGTRLSIDDSACAIMFSPEQVIVGADTSANLVVHGDLVVDGCIIVGGTILAGKCIGDPLKTAAYGDQVLSMRERKKDEVLVPAEQ